jgi:hypothetical protein
MITAEGRKTSRMEFIKKSAQQTRLRNIAVQDLYFLDLISSQLGWRAAAFSYLHIFNATGTYIFTIARRAKLNQLPLAHPTRWMDGWMDEWMDDM